MIQQKSPAELTGVYVAVATKCKELKLTPGRRDTVAPQPSTGEGNINFRTLIQFAESVEPHPENEPEAPKILEQDKLRDGDSQEVIDAKASTQQRKTQDQRRFEAAKAERNENHRALRVLLGALTARFTTAGIPLPEIPKTAAEIAAADKVAADKKAADDKAAADKVAAENASSQVPAQQMKAPAAPPKVGAPPQPPAGRRGPPVG